MAISQHSHHDHPAIATTAGWGIKRDVLFCHWSAQKKSRIRWKSYAVEAGELLD